VEESALVVVDTEVVAAAVVVARTVVKLDAAEVAIPATVAVEDLLVVDVDADRDPVDDPEELDARNVDEVDKVDEDTLAVVDVDAVEDDVAVVD
jgi:hypothetical protein